MRFDFQVACLRTFSQCEQLREVLMESALGKSVGVLTTSVTVSAQELADISQSGFDAD